MPSGAEIPMLHWWLLSQTQCRRTAREWGWDWDWDRDWDWNLLVLWYQPRGNDTESGQLAVSSPACRSWEGLWVFASIKPAVEFGAPSGAEASHLQYHTHFKPTEAQKFFHLLAPWCVRWGLSPPILLERASTHPATKCAQKEAGEGTNTLTYFCLWTWQLQSSGLWSMMGWKL